LCSDIPNQRILKWEEETGAVSVYRKPSNFANGNTRDRQGRLVSCEHGGRRVVRTEYDGSITVLIDSFDGKLLNSPNDVVVKSDGSIWFTDPVFGLLGNYEGYVAESEIDANVYRIDGETGKATIVAEGVLELAIGTIESERGRGVGRQVLARLLELGRERREPGQGEQVDPEQRALAEQGFRDRGEHSRRHQRRGVTVGRIG